MSTSLDVILFDVCRHVINIQREGYYCCTTFLAPEHTCECTTVLTFRGLSHENELFPLLGVSDDLTTTARLYPSQLGGFLFFFHLCWLAPQKRKLLPPHVPHGLFGPEIILHLIKLNGL